MRVLAERDDASISGRSVQEVERCGVGRLELRDVLLDGLTESSAPVVHWNKTFTRYDQLKNGRVRAYFSDGTFEDGDVLVGGDGPNSAVRQQFLPNLNTRGPWSLRYC